MPGALYGVWLGGLVLLAGAGCQITSTTHVPTEAATHQRGKAVVPPGDVLEVYYPVPFVSPPNLTTQSIFDDCSVIEQKPDHFRIKNSNPFSREVTWEARGVPITAVTTPAVQIGVGAPPAPAARKEERTEFANGAK
ncbi:unnamed protein product [Gemmata massiliana]|uniref:Uncharacterized protein n=1 Tax=Gemmata massiliana TaxID=1210884 RepID=A0A6P2DIN8_9BACT|nr:hypothetical protein [Gemmata massiliana]VTS01299.1 unnamed protein product [Gemmata massiliana]